MKAKYTGSQRSEHSHGHSHTHAHDEHLHSHDHSHPHSHDEGYENHDDKIVPDSMSKDEKTLRVLLVHWVDHNKSHQESFNEWIEKSRLMDKEKTADYIQKAVEYMEKANEMLVEAKKNI